MSNSNVLQNLTFIHNVANSDMGMLAFSPNRNRLHSSGGMNYLLICLFSGLTLLMLNSSYCNQSGGCSISTGAKLMIASTVMWFAAGITVMILYPPCEKRRINPEEEHAITPSIRDPLMKEDTSSMRWIRAGNRDSRPPTLKQISGFFYPVSGETQV